MEYLKELQLKISDYRTDSNKVNYAPLCCDPLINFDESPVPFIPWHWHDAVEFFYVESGCIEYSTIHGKLTFPAGSGGFINSGVIHMMRWTDSGNSNVLSLYKFDIASVLDISRIDVKELLGSKVGLVPFFLDDKFHSGILKKMKTLAAANDRRHHRERFMKDLLTDIIEAIIKLESPFLPMDKIGIRTNHKIKMMMSYAHQHYQKPFRMKYIAEQGQLSSYSCHRFFREKLFTTPVDYVNEVRLYFACLMLSETNEYIETIAANCGFCTSSYFGKLFKEKFRCTPSEYRLSKQAIKSIGR